ncbi:MAG: hypothetical protein ACI9IA_000567 [Enterobacterales bacterium]|jgi:hypothetical protein
MPKLNLDEIEIMLDDDLDEYMKPYPKKKLLRRAEVKRRLDDHFEQRHLKRETNYDFID